MDMTRIEKVIEGMRQMNLEQFLVTDPMAVYYLTGQYYACGERMMVLRLDVEKEPVLVIGKLFPQDEEKLGIKVVYFDDTDDCVEVLASHMRKGGTIGIDKTWPARFLLRLMELQVGDAYVNASTIIDHIRQITTAEEQETMRVASRCNDISIEELIPLVSKGMTPAEELLIRSIPQAMAETERVCSSVNVGSTKTGINMDAVKLMGEIILATAEATKDQDSLGCAKLVVFCNAPDDNPFMAGAFHGVTEADCIINVGVSGPGVVKKALEQVRGEDFGTLCEMIKRTAFKVTRVGQLVAREASKRLDVPFGIVDLSLAPTPAIGDSVAEILEEIGLERAGAPGTTAALALLNDQVKKGGVMAAAAVGGLSGAFIPVSEDQGMIDAVNEGALTLEKLEAMTCVCSVGLDMIAVPGDTKATTLAGIIADESAIGMVNQKTTAVRLIPVIGKGVGETVEFGGLLGYAPIMPVNQFSCDAFVERGGRIPAPIHSFKN